MGVVQNKSTHLFAFDGGVCQLRKESWTRSKKENDMTQILFILAAVCFGLGAARVGKAVDWASAGFCLLTIALWLA
jgi:hypothetical protein